MYNPKAANNKASGTALGALFFLQKFIKNACIGTQRTLQDWEAGKRTPPGWAEALVIEKLEKIVQDNQARMTEEK